MRRPHILLPWISLVLFAALASSPAQAQHLAPGLNELVIYDPGTHERGLPGVVLEDVEGGLQIDIPPKIHVHRYYYSGDKEYQGPIVQGGPTVVVASHPKTGQQMYIDVVLPPGAPRIAYSKSCITYVYPRQRVAVHFQSFPFNTEKAVVKYHSGQGIGRTLGQVYEHVATSTRNHCRQSQLAQSLKKSACDTGEFVHGVTQAAGCATGRLVEGTSSLLGALPGVTPLKSMAGERGYRRKAAEIQGADLRQRHTETQFVPTNR